MSKFKFSNKSDAGGEGIEVIPCKHMKKCTYRFADAGGEITAQFDKNDDQVVRLNIDSQWFSVEDLGNLIELLKAAKKRVEKIALKREQRSGGF